MTNELKIISTIGSSREAYLKLAPFVSPEVFSTFCGKVYHEIAKWYESDKKTDIVDFEFIKSYLQKEEPKKTNLIEEFFASLPNPSSADNIARLYKEQYKEHLREELILALGSNRKTQISELIDKYQSVEIEEEQEEIFNDVSIEELQIHFSNENLIPIYPSALNEALGGGVPRQSQICIYARPDVGKTTVAINATVGAAESGFKVLYLGNEDPSAKMVLRMLTRFTRKPERELLTNPKLYKDAVAKGYKNLYFVSAHPGNAAFLKKYVEKIKPDLMVVDQIRTMHFSKESMTMNLEYGVRFTRSLAKEFNLVSIVVTQAGDSASNRIVLRQEDVEWSNTGVAGQMDLMLGVGQNEIMKATGQVCISIPKNKLTAPLSPMTVSIDYALNRLTTK